MAPFTASPRIRESRELRIVGFVICCLLVAGIATAVRATGSPKPRLSHLTEILLHDGVNEVQFDLRHGGDRAGHAPNRTIAGRIISIPENTEGPAEGHNYLTVAPADSWSLTPVDGLGALVRDEPEHNSCKYRSVRFFRGMLDGLPTTLLFIAQRDIWVDYYRPARVTISVFRLSFYEQPGAPVSLDQIAHGSFDQIYKLHTPRKYCNADEALLTELSVPVPPDFRQD